jgi:hypothetical protein
MGKQYHGGVNGIVSPLTCYVGIVELVSSHTLANMWISHAALMRIVWSLPKKIQPRASIVDFATCYTQDALRSLYLMVIVMAGRVAVGEV